MFKIFLISIFMVLNLYSNEVFILPKLGDEIKDKISDFIQSSKSEIQIAMYNFSYKKFAKDLVDASKKGVKITVFLDAKKVKEDSEIADFLKKNDIKGTKDRLMGWRCNKLLYCTRREIKRNNGNRSCRRC